MFAGFMRSPEATFPGAISLVLMIWMPVNPGKAIAQQLGPGGLIFPLPLGAILSQLVQASQKLLDVSHPFPSLWNNRILLWVRSSLADEGLGLEVRP